MPVRSLDSRVLKWPDRAKVRAALDAWAHEAAAAREDLVAVGMFGSYARGEAGPGSDVDVLLILSDTDLPFHERAGEWDLTGLPVPADVLVYSSEELERLRREGQKFATVVDAETDWVYRR